MENRICCKNCKYCKDFMINGNTKTFCTMFNEIFGESRLYTIDNVNMGKCEMFEGLVIWERGKYIKEIEKEFKEIKTIELNKNPIEKLILGSNFELLSDFKKSKECIYLEVGGQFIALSFSEWDLLNQYVEKLREFK